MTGVTSGRVHMRPFSIAEEKAKNWLLAKAVTPDGACVDWLPGRDGLREEARPYPEVTGYLATFARGMQVLDQHGAGQWHQVEGRAVDWLVARTQSEPLGLLPSKYEGHSPCGAHYLFDHGIIARALAESYRHADASRSPCMGQPELLGQMLTFFHDRVQAGSVVFDGKGNPVPPASNGPHRWSHRLNPSLAKAAIGWQEVAKFFHRLGETSSAERAEQLTNTLLTVSRRFQLDDSRWWTHRRDVRVCALHPLLYAAEGFILNDNPDDKLLALKIVRWVMDIASLFEGVPETVILTDSDTPRLPAETSDQVFRTDATAQLLRLAIVLADQLSPLRPDLVTEIDRLARLLLSLQTDDGGFVFGFGKNGQQRIGLDNRPTWAVMFAIQAFRLYEAFRAGDTSRINQMVRFLV